jgi:putative sigma-54 modulation protein
MASKPTRSNGSKAPERAPRRRARVKSKPAAKVTVTFRHVDPTEAIRQYAERKLAPLARLLKRPCDIHLILSVDKYRQHGEVTLKSGAFGLTAQHQTKDLYAVIDLLADKVARQVTRHHEKTLSRRLRTPSTGEVMSLSESES